VYRNPRLLIAPALFRHKFAFSRPMAYQRCSGNGRVIGMLKVNTRIGRISLTPILICIVLIGALLVFGKGKLDIPRLYQIVQGSPR